MRLPVIACAFLAATIPSLPVFAQLPPCDGTPLLDEYSDTGQRALLILLSAGRDWNSPGPNFDETSWSTARSWAVTKLKAVTQACDQTRPVQFPPSAGPGGGSMFVDSFLSFGPTLYEVIEAENANHPFSSPVLSQVLGALGGIPIPHRLQLGISQVVSAGQLGFAVNAAGALSPTGAWFLRHSSVAGSLLVMQPTGTGMTGGLANPQFASVELMYAFNGTRTAYDAIEAVIRTANCTGGNAADIAAIEQQCFAGYVEQSGRFAAQALVRGYHNSAPSPGENTDQTDVEAAVGRSLDLYQSRIRRFWLTNFIEPERAREQSSGHIEGALRVRLSPRPEYIPEVPDLFSSSLVVAGEYSLATGSGGNFAVEGRLIASLDSYPTDTCPRLSSCGFKPVFVGDVSAGLSLGLRTNGSAALTTLRASGILRYTSHEYDAAGDAYRFSGGFTASLEVPVSSTFSLVGTYTARWLGGELIATSGITAAARLAE